MAIPSHNSACTLAVLGIDVVELAVFDCGEERAPSSAREPKHLIAVILAVADAYVSFAQRCYFDAVTVVGTRGAFPPRCRYAAIRSFLRTQMPSIQLSQACLQAAQFDCNARLGLAFCLMVRFRMTRFLPPAVDPFHQADGRGSDCDQANGNGSRDSEDLHLNPLLSGHGWVTVAHFHRT